MEDFILNQYSGQNGTSRGLHQRGPEFARSEGVDLSEHKGAYKAEKLAASHAILRDSVSSEHFPDMPYFRLRPPGPSAAGQPVFLTWILHDSVPHDGVPNDQFDSSAAPSSWKAFASVDRFLDEARTGPLYLRQREVAIMVVETARAYGSALRQYDLHSFVVMPNHVHLLLTPRVDLTGLTRTVKGVIAKRANELLDQPDTLFWDEANWEHLVADDHEFGRIRQYIERNPVPVGMAREAADYPYSSAARGRMAQSA
jgi:REP element-mobilizing transposase RayT